MNKLKAFFDFYVNHIKIKITEDKTSSRKYKLILLIFFAATLMCVLPPVLSVFVFKTQVLIILSGVEWVTLMTTLVGFYYTSNVIQKKIIDTNNKLNQSIKTEGKDE